MLLIILDRDGVINNESDEHIKSPDEWVPIPGSLEAIARLSRADYRVVVVTNQSGIAKGLFDIDMLNRIHARMLERVRQKGGEIDAIFFCPHGPDDLCACRKPRPGMLVDLAGRLKINLAAVPAVGDSLRDLQAARAAGAMPILVRSGKGEVTESQLIGTECASTPVFDDLSAFVGALVSGGLRHYGPVQWRPAV